MWTVLTYCTEGWTLTKADEKTIESAELWIYRQMIRVSWTEHTEQTKVSLHSLTPSHSFHDLLYVANSPSLDTQSETADASW